MRDDVHAAGLFEPLAFGPLTLPNRLAVAPMTRVSATATGLPTARMADYYARLADGGFGLVITEGVYTDTAFAQGYLHQPGLANDAQRDAWRPVVVGVRLSQAKINDFTYRWRGEAEAAAIFRTVGALHIDYLHVTEYEAWRPAFDAGPSLAALARRHGGRPVLANGGLHDPARALGMIARGDADAVSLGRGALAQADWPLRVRDGVPLAPYDPALLSPLADLEHADRRRNAYLPPG